MNFSKDIILVLKSMVELVFPHPHYSLKKLPQTFALLLFPWPTVLPGSSWCADIRESVFWFGPSKREPSLGNIAWDKTLKKWPSPRAYQQCESVHIVCDTAAKSGFLATISLNVKFLKIVLKSEGIISHEHFLMLFLQPFFFLFKSRRKHSPWCSFHDLF